MENDAISRSAVLEILSNEFDMAAEERAEADNEKDRAFNAGEINCARRSTRKVKDLPALDVAPVVHARWVGGKYYNDVYGYEKTCTACEQEYVVGFDYLYCPYCGARMDGEADG